MRLGMITPSSNTCLEPTTYHLLTGRDDVTAHFARLPVRRIALDTAANRQFALDEVATAARELADAEVDVIVWNGTSGSWLGLDHDRALVSRISETVGVPATTSTLAVIEACRIYGVTELALATPYTADVNVRIRNTFAAHGIEIVADSSLGIEDNHAIGRVSESRVADQVREVAPSAHAVTVLCTNVHGARLAEELEAELEVPLFDSVAATLWHAMLLGGADGVGGFGTLLRDGQVRARMQDLCEELTNATGAARTTLRIDLPEHGLHIDTPSAEAVRPGVRSIRRERSLRMRQLDTVRWLETHRRNLVQPDFETPPAPPQALKDIYGVKAQVLGPVERAGEMPGFFSLHSMRERTWTDSDLAALDKARTTAEALVAEITRR